MSSIMPSWSIHTAHVERLLAEHPAGELGIADANAFLFGNYVPDLYLGFMVQDTTYRIDYCLTHLAEPATIPVPDADRFWDECIAHPIRRAEAQSGTSLALGAWAHLVADRMYNERFRAFCQTHDVPSGDELRERKQADFHLFGNSLPISSHVEATPELLEAARAFQPYSILPADLERGIEVASGIVRHGAPGHAADDYRLLSAEWMNATFDACNDFLATWLTAWQQLASESARFTAADIRNRTHLDS